MQIVTCKKCGSKNRVDPSRIGAEMAKCGKCGTVLEAGATEPLKVTDASFQHDVIEVKGQPVLLDAWAPWCGPCRMVGPIMEQLAAEANGRYRIAKLNVDDNPRTAAQFGIQSIPTMLIFKNGQLVDRIVGAQPKAAIAARLLAQV
jgi:thioredoxin 2